jgi:hypothetical protein
LLFSFGKRKPGGGEYLAAFLFLSSPQAVAHHHRCHVGNIFLLPTLCKFAKGFFQNDNHFTLDRGDTFVHKIFFLSNQELIIIQPLKRLKHHRIKFSHDGSELNKVRAK